MNEHNLSEEQQNELNHLKQLINFPAWNYFKSELEDQKKYIEEEIFKVNPKDNEKVFTKKDVLRLQREYLILLSNLPENIIDRLNQVLEIEDNEE